MTAPRRQHRREVVVPVVALVAAEIAMLATVALVVAARIG